MFFYPQPTEFHHVYDHDLSNTRIWTSVHTNTSHTQQLPGLPGSQTAASREYSEVHVSKPQACPHAGEPCSLELSWTSPSCHGCQRLHLNQPAGLTHNMLKGSTLLFLRTHHWRSPVVVISIWLLRPRDSILPAQIDHTISYHYPSLYSSQFFTILPQCIACLLSTTQVMLSFMEFIRLGVPFSPFPLYSTGMPSSPHLIST